MKLRDLKQEIIKQAIDGYKVVTNFSSPEFLVSLGNIIIIAKPICTEKEFKYEFMLDTQFLSKAEITYEEIVMVKNVIEILNANKKLAISRLKKWTVEEYLENQRKKQIMSEKMLEVLKEMMIRNAKNN